MAAGHKKKKSVVVLRWQTIGSAQGTIVVERTGRHHGYNNKREVNVGLGRILPSCYIITLMM